MAEHFDPLAPHANTDNPYQDVEYGTIEASSTSTRNDSAVIVSPTELPRPSHSCPHQHRIIPPSIRGHGRLIIAHRVVPHWVGVTVVVGAFTWAVCCAIYVYLIVRGPSRD